MTGTVLLFLIIFFNIMAVLCLTSLPVNANGSADDTIVTNTLAALDHRFNKTEPVSPELRNAVSTLDYTGQRLVRRFSSLEDFSHQNLSQILEFYLHHPLPFAAIQLIDQFLLHKGADASMGLDLLEHIPGKDIETLNLLTEVLQDSRLSPEEFLSVLKPATELPPPGRWALRRCLARVHPGADMTQSVLFFLQAMNPTQQWALEGFCNLKEVNHIQLSEVLPFFSELDTGSSNSGRALFGAKSLPVSDAVFLLSEFLQYDRSSRDALFSQLPEKIKNTLIAAYDRGARDTAGGINRLHAITDRYGRELGVNVLRTLSDDKLRDILENLSPEKDIITEFEKELRSNNRDKAILSLRKAVTQARRALATELTTVNLALLISGSAPLYTSSVIEIIIPEFKKRIAEQYHGDPFLLTELLPGTIQDRLILQLAGYNRLTSFIPSGKAIHTFLQRVLATALKTESSLLLFSPSLEPLFTSLPAPLRRRMLQHLLELSHSSAPLSNQIILILEYLHHHRGTLIASDQQTLIQQRIKSLQTDFLEKGQKTPFDEWRKDGRIGTLSIFPADDDGYSSYLSYCMRLVKNNYTINGIRNISREETEQYPQEVPAQYIKNPSRRPGDTCNRLFRFSGKRPIVVDWGKMVHGIKLVQTMSVSRSIRQQEHLLSSYFEDNYEVLAQRGHSYWRRSQLIAPLAKLKKKKDKKLERFFAERSSQHLISLGSCGGIRLYNEIHGLLPGMVTLMGTTGTGRMKINNAVNQFLPELAASTQNNNSWPEILNSPKMKSIFETYRTDDYIFPGTLVDLLYRHHFSLEKKP